MLKVNIAQLENEGIEFKGEISPKTLELNTIPDKEIIFNDNIEYSLHISLVSNGVLVAGTISTYMHTICGRCLKEYSQEIKNLEICHFYENISTPSLDIAPAGTCK